MRAWRGGAGRGGGTGSQPALQGGAARPNPLHTRTHLSCQGPPGGCARPCTRRRAAPRRATPAPPGPCPCRPADSDRHGTLTAEGVAYPVTLLDLPAVVESYKTLDDTNLVKITDVGQVGGFVPVNKPVAVGEG